MTASDTALCWKYSCISFIFHQAAAAAALMVKTEYVKCCEAALSSACAPLHFFFLLSCLEGMFVVSNRRFITAPFLRKSSARQIWSASLLRLFLCRTFSALSQRCVSMSTCTRWKTGLWIQELVNLGVWAHYGKAEGQFDVFPEMWLAKRVEPWPFLTRLAFPSQAHIKKFCGSELEELGLYYFLKCFWMRRLNVVRTAAVTPNQLAPCSPCVTSVMGSIVSRLKKSKRQINHFNCVVFNSISGSVTLWLKWMHYRGEHKLEGWER